MPGKVIGIDVSRFQEEIDWERVPTDRVRFAFVQASRGSGDDCTVRPRRCGTDGWYEFNYRNARAAGIPVGAYHRAFVNGDSLYEAKQDAREEAAVFLRRVGHLRRGDLLPVLDLEPPFDGLTPRQLRGWTRVWLRRVRRRLGVRPMIYTSQYGWRPTGNTRLFARAGHRLWVANWEVSLADDAGPQLGRAAAGRSGSSRARAGSGASAGPSISTGSAWASPT